MSLVKIANKLPKLNGMFFGAYVIPPIPTYKITLFPSQNGSISADTLEGIEGTLVTLSNTPDTHYSFGGYGITGATLTGNQFLIGQDDISVQGTFIEDAKYSLSLTQTTGGSINANKNTGYAGDIITLSNTPSSHYTFNGYSITGATLTGNQFAFGSQNVTAKGTFVADPIRTVTLTQVAGGNITANPTTGYDGTTVTLSNTANAGYTFNNYTLTGGTLTGNKFVLNGGNATASLNLTHNVYNLTLQTNGNGKLAAGKTTGYYNNTTTLTATPSADNIFSAYTVTGGTINGNTFTFGTSNATAKAWFYPKPVRKLYIGNTSGIGELSADKYSGYDGDRIYLTATSVKSGYKFNGCTYQGYAYSTAYNYFKFNGGDVTANGSFTRTAYAVYTASNNDNVKITTYRWNPYYTETNTGKAGSSLFFNADEGPISKLTGWNISGAASYTADVHPEGYGGRVIFKNSDIYITALLNEQTNSSFTTRYMKQWVDGLLYYASRITISATHTNNIELVTSSHEVNIVNDGSGMATIEMSRPTSALGQEQYFRLRVNASATPTFTVLRYGEWDTYRAAINTGGNNWKVLYVGDTFGPA